MTIEELYEKLSSKEFQDTEHGDIFYNFYLFQYNAEEEYSMRRQIEQFTVNLARPTNYLDVLKLNLFDEFCRFLDGMSFGKIDDSQLHYFLTKDNAGQHDAVLKSLTAKANSRQFYEYINRRIMEHVNADSTGKKPTSFSTASALCSHSSAQVYSCRATKNSTKRANIKSSFSIPAKARETLSAFSGK